MPGIASAGDDREIGTPAPYLADQPDRQHRFVHRQDEGAGLTKLQLVDEGGARNVAEHHRIALAPRRGDGVDVGIDGRSEEHTSELQSLMRISYAVFCLKKNTTNNITH